MYIHVGRTSVIQKENEQNKKILILHYKHPEKHMKERALRKLVQQKSIIHLLYREI